MKKKGWTELKAQTAIDPNDNYYPGKMADDLEDVSAQGVVSTVILGE